MKTLLQLYLNVPLKCTSKKCQGDCFSSKKKKSTFCTIIGSEMAFLFSICFIHEIIGIDGALKSWSHRFSGESELESLDGVGVRNKYGSS